jgi:hypothetical protein
MNTRNRLFFGSAVITPHSWRNQRQQTVSTADAALPQRMAVSLRLTVLPLKIFEATPLFLAIKFGGVAAELQLKRNGKPEAYRYVLRQSRASNGRSIFLTHCRGFMILILSTRLLLVKPRAQGEQGYAQAEQRQVMWQESLDAYSLQHDAANYHDPVTQGIEDHQRARPIL